MFYMTTKHATCNDEFAGKLSVILGPLIRKQFAGFEEKNHLFHPVEGRGI